jgi:hypothetical protein
VIKFRKIINEQPDVDISSGVDGISSTLEGFCPNCGAPVSGRYCHHCGQKQRTPHDYRLLHFLLHAFHELTDLDSKVLRSIRYLLFNPGKLTAEWRTGREESFIKPVRLFILVNIFYFIFLHFFPVISIVVPLDAQYRMEIYSHAIRPIVDEKIKSSHTTYDKFAKSYDEASSEQAKTLVILMVPLFALVLAVLYFFQHRYFVEHLVFSLHFYSFLLLLISLGLMVLTKLAVFGAHLFGFKIQESIFHEDAWLTYSSGILIVVYLIVAIGRVYGGKWWINVLRALFLSYGVLIVLFLYRFILFFTAIYIPSSI